MPGVKKSNDVELQLHESDATDQTEVGRVISSCSAVASFSYNFVAHWVATFSPHVSTCRALQDTLVAIRVTLPGKDDDTDDPSPAESLQRLVSKKTA